MFGVEGFREFTSLYTVWADDLPYERLHLLTSGLSIFMIRLCCVCQLVDQNLPKIDHSEPTKRFEK